MEWWAIWFLLVVVIWFCEFVISAFNKFVDKEIAKGTIKKTNALEADFSKYKHELSEQLEERENNLIKREQALEILSKEKTQGFPWLAEALAEFTALLDEERALLLENKPHPALRGAEEVRKIKAEKRNLIQTNKILEYIVKYYEHLFPWLIDYKDEAIDDLLIKYRVNSDTDRDENDGQYDHARDWLSEGEYNELPSTTKYQRALDHYQDRPKSKWEIGRDYERYIGYLWEQKGFTVYYQGILHGYEDHGRDLICIDQEQVTIIQCKCWSASKTIHEKHINQLFGTIVEYWINENKGKNASLFWDHYESGKIVGRLTTSTDLSEAAYKFANALNIEIDANVPLGNYPVIKCNISLRDGSKIYHLPFDQQYDKVQINKPGECYVFRVQEAENLGFRKAHRWNGHT